MKFPFYILLILRINFIIRKLKIVKYIYLIFKQIIYIQEIPNKQIKLNILHCFRYLRILCLYSEQKGNLPFTLLNINYDINYFNISNFFRKNI